MFAFGCGVSLVIYWLGTDRLGHVKVLGNCKRVTTSPVIVRMVANCVAVMLPVALILVCNAPMIAARLPLARMSSTSTLIDTVSARISRMISAIVLRPVPAAAARRQEWRLGRVDFDKRASYCIFPFSWSFSDT